MNKNLITLLTITLLSINGNAQFKHKGREKIRAYKIAFLTDKLDLSPKQAEKFWPVYNAYDKKMTELHHKRRIGIRKQIGNPNNLEEKLAKKLVEEILLLEEERLKTKRDFFNKTKSILSYKKLLELEIAEHEFNRKLMHKLRGKSQKPKVGN